MAWLDFCVERSVCLCVSGDNRSPWLRLRLDDGSSYFFHLRRLEGTWQKPGDFVQNSVFLDPRHIQVSPPLVLPLSCHPAAD